MGKPNTLLTARRTKQLFASLYFCVGITSISLGQSPILAIDFDASSFTRPVLAKEEVWMYFDGINVAIYNIAGLKGLESPLSTVLGGSDEKWEYGSTGQWNAFNGYLDEIKIWDRPLSGEEVKNLYTKFRSFYEEVSQLPPADQIKVMAWNIWHGGHRYGQHVGVQRVVEVIKNSNADISNYRQATFRCPKRIFK